MVLGGLVNAEIGANASENASSQMVNQLQKGIDYSKGVYTATAPTLQPYMNTGTQATQQLANGLGPGGNLGRGFSLADFQKSPAYAFNLQNALRAIGNSASARGGALGGTPVKDMEAYATNMAGNSFGQAEGQFVGNQRQNTQALLEAAGQGQTAANNLGRIGMGISGQSLQGAEGQANALGAGTMGRSSALQGGVGNIANGLSAAYQANTAPPPPPPSTYGFQYQNQQQGLLNPNTYGFQYQNQQGFLNPNTLGTGSGS